MTEHGGGPGPRFDPAQWTAPPPPRTGGDDGSRRLLIGALCAVIVAGLVVLVLAVSGAFSPDADPAGPSPTSSSSPAASDTGSSSDDSSTSASAPTSASSGTTSSYNLCASTQDALSTAKLFVSFITLSSADQAAQCVYQGRVSEDDIKALTGSGKLYAPSGLDGQDGPDFTVKSSGGETTLTFRVEQIDGKYWVVSASDS